MTFTHPFKKAGASLSATLIAALSTGCVGDIEGEGAFDDDHIGQADFEIKQVPSGVTCIRVSVAGATTVTKDFGQLATGASTSSLNMDRLPLGNVSISAMAFATSASATSCTANQTPLWVADAATALLEPGVVSKLDLTFRKNNPVTASVNFVGNIQGIAASTYHTVLLVDGQVYQWGSTSVDQPTPTLISGLSNVMAVTAGPFFSCALKNDGTIWCWGGNVDVGAGSTTPTQLATGRVYSQVDAGGSHVCGISGAAAYCWGINTYGELGVNPATTPTVPHTAAVTSASSGVAAIEIDTYHSCQIATDLDLRCVGLNASGELARTTSGTSTYSFGDAPNSSPIVDVAVGEGSFTIVAMADGSVQSAGSNTYGQLGLGTVGGGGSNTSTQLTPVPGIGSAIAVSAGTSHALALLEDGSVKAWGYNASGQLGDETNTTRPSPVTVVGLPPARLVAAGVSHSCAVTQDERVFCWGEGSNSQLGIGTKVNSARPVALTLP